VRIVEKCDGYPLDGLGRRSTLAVRIPNPLPVPFSERRLQLIGLLNERGIAGSRALWVLKHYSWDRITTQIAYYDFELAFPERAALPKWAASPWLLHRIKRNLPGPVHNASPH